MSCTGNAVKSANFLVLLCGFVTLWQEKIATKTQKHKVSQRKNNFIFKGKYN